MKVEICVPEVVGLFKEIQDRPQKIFDLIRFEIHEVVGRYLTELMKAELTHFLGREHYERDGSRGGSNHRNGSYDRNLNPWADGWGICSVQQIAPVHRGGFAVRAPSMGASLHKYPSP